MTQNSKDPNYTAGKQRAENQKSWNRDGVG